jgi:hypothetical protein
MALSWGRRRQIIILLNVGAVIVAIIAWFSFLALYHAPTCTDGVQNQGETGVDCGGPCAAVCTDAAHAPVVLYARALPKDGGRIDVAASVTNPNQGAEAHAVQYTLTLYGAQQVFVKRVTGTLDLPAGATVPVFIPNLSVGYQSDIHALLAIASSTIAWRVPAPGDVSPVPQAGTATVGGTHGAPRITATLTNDTTGAMQDVPVVVFVSDAAGNVIAASETIVPNVPAQGQATATFTWNQAFSATPSVISITPIAAVAAGGS